MSEENYQISDENIYKKDTKLKLYNNLVKAIIFEEFSQGEKLIESELMEKYGASRYITREVIKKLENEGFVEAIPNRGAKVRKISIPEIEEIFSLLIILESKAAELAALMRNENDVDTLCRLYEETLEYTANRDYNGWAEVNKKIHVFIGNLSGYQILPKLLEDLRNRIYRQRFILSISNYIEKYNEEHKKIIDSIANKKPGESAECMKFHLETAKQNRINLLNSFRSI